MRGWDFQIDIKDGYNARAQFLWNKVAEINESARKETGARLWHIVNDIELTKAAIFIFHFMYLGTDAKYEGCGLTEEESDRYLHNLCVNGIFKKGKFYIDWGKSRNRMVKFYDGCNDRCRSSG